MASVLICSADDLSRALAQTLIGREGIDRFKATRSDEVCLKARIVCARVILVDRDLPNAGELVRALREEPATHNLSVAILAWGDLQSIELELLQLGANAIFRLPPDAGWDERMARLLDVPTRHEARFPVKLAVDTAGDGEAPLTQTANLSVKGMLIESTRPLALSEEFDFSLRLPGGSRVSGRGRIMRQAAPGQYGFEFVRLDGQAQEAIRQFVRSATLGQSG